MTGSAHLLGGSVARQGSVLTFERSPLFARGRNQLRDAKIVRWTVRDGTTVRLTIKCRPGEREPLGTSTA